MDDPKRKRILRDRLSSLPDGIIEHILSRLPLREAARTSVLSQEWKHKWVNRPVLAFSKSFWTNSNTVDRLVANIFKVLCFHRGPLRSLALTNPYLRGYPAEVDQILLSLVEKCIQRLFIRIDGYKVSSCLFSFTKLKMLHLSGCVFTSSHISFEEFTLLTHLHLASVKFQNVDGVSLLIKCSLLQVFTVLDYCNVAISIEAPNLKKLALVGGFRSLRVSNTPLLVSVSVYPIPSFLGHPNNNQPNATDFVKLLDGRSELKVLATTLDLIGDLLRLYNLPQQVRLNSLRQLMLYEVRLNDAQDFVLLLTLVYLHSGLQELVIIMDTMKHQNLEGDLGIMEEDYEELKDGTNRLRMVTLHKLLGTKVEMSFIQCLLAISPELEQMTIDFSKKAAPADQIQCYKELNGFKRASTRAQIILN